MAKKKIYIVGGGGFAMESYDALTKVLKESSEYEFVGFLGHNGNLVETKNIKAPFLGDESNFDFTEDDYAIIGVGNVEIRHKIFQDLDEKGVKFYTLISKECRVSEFSDYGKANVFINAVISPNAKIGNGNLFNEGTFIGHDCQIGNFNFVSPKSTLLGNSSLGNFNSIGTNAIVLPKAKIGNNNKISPLSVVYKGCKNNCCMHGNPALKLLEV